MFNAQEFTSVYPEFAGLQIEVVQYAGDREDAIVSDTSWGQLRKHALYLRVAHRLAVRYNIGKQYRTNGLNNASTSALTTSKSASNASLSEGSELNAFTRSENPIWADFGRTAYGLEYLSLLEENMPYGEVILSPRVVDVLR